MRITQDPRHFITREKIICIFFFRRSKQEKTPPSTKNESCRSEPNRLTNGIVALVRITIPYDSDLYGNEFYKVKMQCESEINIL